jgi:hypothetical protein
VWVIFHLFIKKNKTGDTREVATELNDREYGLLEEIGAKCMVFVRSKRYWIIQRNENQQHSCEKKAKYYAYKKIQKKKIVPRQTPIVSPLLLFLK